MNFNTLFLKSFRVLLLPLAALYGLIIVIRNRLFDRQILKSAEFNFPIICVGNLAVGGTGKSPMVEYLLTLLSPNFKMATLSRGYKRRTKGYALANNTTTALEIGDEPMQFALKFPNVAVAVGEERIVAIPHLLQDHPDLQGIILDDAFQHRTVKAGFNILLTEYNNLYTSDFFLPTGDLRDEWASAKRAQVIIVTKCPSDLNESAKEDIIKDLQPLPEQRVYFSTIEYGIPYHICDANIQYAINSLDEVMLVCGIANPKPLKDYLLQKAKTYYQQDYADHHIFSIDDLKEIKQLYDEISAERKLIVTTEKDAVRLIKFKEELKSMPFFVIPIRHRILFDESWQLNDQLIKFIQHFPFKPITAEHELEKA